MCSLLLAIIYLAFISLGLPDALLGAAWPLMVDEFAVPIANAGIISMIISAGTIVSSLASAKFSKKYGTGLITAFSAMLTAIALFGFSMTNSFWLLCMIAIPYGLGAGAIDAALNNFVAIHYASKHMSWLHCFWGIGATAGPYIMGWTIGNGSGWRIGYGIVAGIQLALAIGLFSALPLWKKNGHTFADEQVPHSAIGLNDAMRIKGVKSIMLAFFGYCGFESTAGLWASSFLEEYKGIDVETAATFASLFYLGITMGRFISGFVANRFGDRNMIRIGTSIIFSGILLIALPNTATSFVFLGVVLLGIGAAPVYPSIIHSIPYYFGKEHSETIVGIQMASAYCGSTLMPLIFGFLAQYVHIAVYPYYLMIFVVLLLLMTERVNRVCRS